MAPKPDQICSICRWQLQLTDTVCLANKLAIFQMSSDQYPNYFTAQSCLHILNRLSMATWNWPKYAVICAVITGQSQIPQNSGKT